MKELSIEEKAKAYDKAFERVKELLSRCTDNRDRRTKVYRVEDIESIFPELKENDDERVKRILYSITSKMGFHIHDIFTEEEFQCFDAWSYAWLEKQGEQNLIKANSPQLGEQKSAKNIVETWKDMRLEVYQQASGNRHEPNYSDDTTKMFSLNDIDEIIEKMSEQKLADKVEPKFHEGEWITNGNYTWKIVEVKPLDYILQSQDGNIVDDTISYVDEQFHSFTIEDAKDGDVLVTVYDKRPLIYKGCLDPNHLDSPVAYCGIDSEGYFICSCVDKFNHWWTDEKVQPATKEQRDLLFQKMKEDGYEWDEKKKELKKIKMLPTEWSEEEELSCFESALFTAFSDAWQSYLLGEEVNVKQWAKEQSKELLEAAKEELKGHNSAWSEEDETYLDLINTAIKLYYTDDKGKENPWRNELLRWLKSLKDRIIV